MYWTKSFITTLKEAPESAESVSHQLMLRTGMVRDEMNKTGAQEVLLPGLQPLDLWQKTGRDELMGETMFRFTDRRGRKLCLGPTHEEVVTELAAGFVK